MEQANIESLYQEIMLLSEIDKSKLYLRMQKALYNNQKTIAYTTTGKPLNAKQYIEKIGNAIAQANRGELITDEELQKEMETW
ncbi:MAG: hypothetical protein LBT78_12670 [Tannerella sp.]|jgi:hypothetical protein|nr:hypothetical protein [Tannerella sp.]